METLSNVSAKPLRELHIRLNPPDKGSLQAG